MRDINEIMPKIPGMVFGAVTNVRLTMASINEICRVMPKDEKWHTLFESPNDITIDGKTIRRTNAERLT